MSNIERYQASVPDTRDQAHYFDLLMRQAEVLAQSNVLPSAYRRRSADIIAAGLAGRAFGWDVMTALNNYHVIEGTASLKPEAMLGLVRRMGHSVTLTIETTADGKVGIAKGRRADNGDEHVARFSTHDAVVAGLAGKKNWKQYEDAMLTWRAVSALCRVLFPDVVMGAGYTPEEIGGPVPTHADEDPLGEAYLSSLEAKRTLLEHCDGDKNLAREIWGDRGQDVIAVEELEAMIDQAKKTADEVPADDDIVDAEILEVLGAVLESEEPKTSPRRARLGSKAQPDTEEKENQHEH
jgi:hypothetical protein